MGVALRTRRFLARHVAPATVMCGLIAGLLSAGPCVIAAPPGDLARAAEDLDDDRFPVRRQAEATLERVGWTVLAGSANEESARGWNEAVVAALRRGGSPAAAARRVLRRLETGADDEQVVRMPRLLEARLSRRLPEVVMVRQPGGSRNQFEAIEDERPVPPSTADVALFSLRSLMPEATSALLDLVRRTSDPRLLAGALVALCDIDGDAPTNDALVGAMLEAWDRSPETVASIAPFEGPYNVDPLSMVALALVVGGRSTELATLRTLTDRPNDFVSFNGWLRHHVKRTEGLAELDTGEFLARVEEGTATAAVEREAARRAIEADVPWLARLLARRALFLRPDDTEATTLLATAYTRVGLGATAQQTRVERLPTEGAAPVDDPGAAYVEASLRAGKLSTRLVFSRECGTASRVGVVASATHDDVIVHGTTEGSIVAVDRHSGDERSIERTGRAGLPIAIVRIGDRFEVLNAGGGLVSFEWGRDQRLARVGKPEPGPYLAMTTDTAGDVWLVAQHRRVYRRTGDEPPVHVPAIPNLERYRARRAAMLGKDRLMLHDERGEVSVVDVTTGSTEVVVRADRGVRAVAASRDEILVAFRDGWARYGADGTERHRVYTENGGDVVGIGGDVVADLVVTVAADRCVGYGRDGAVRFDEQLGGSSNPTVSDGLVVIPAGSGQGPVGDRRLDRTMHVLRAGTSATEPFPVEARIRAVEAAITATVDGRDDVALALLDPLSGWLSRTEEHAARAALSEAQAVRRGRNRAPEPDPDDMGEDEGEGR